MKTLKPFIDAVLNIWQENSPAGRVGILLLAGICAIAIAGVGYWSVQPSYVVLVSESEGEKVDRVIDALDKAGIEYQLSGAGGNLLVDKRDYAKAKLLARGTGVATADDMMSGSLGGAFGSPTERRNLARIQKQNQLAATIKKMNVVENADVHLNLPEKGPFERRTSTPTASVLLTLRNGERLSEQQAESIASFVAFAVEDLRPEAVQITDKDGRNYTIPDEGTKQISNQVEYIAEAESKLARKAEEQLFHFLGHGNASVQVSLDYTFTNGSTTITKYDPDGKVASQEDLISESTTNSEEPPTGAAGVASNLQSRRKGSASVLSKTENIKTSYLVPKTEETQANVTPTRNLMTVSVIVNSGAPGLKSEDGTLLAGLDQKVTSIVKNAVGFREDTDAISVELLPFPSSSPDTEIALAPFDWQNLTSLVEKASLAIAAVFAFVMGFLLLKRIRPITESGADVAQPQLDRERLENVSQLSQLVKENPEVFERIVKAWSGAEKEESNPQRKAA
ncbi:flagellar basal-body MS-ring/collar protein FliF [Stieleria varia]|uniref:Flagellar M-ring protein n=1 Tax=Stieleria varia TaxID=2528005 RepID=A0A5C6AT38_9BACT|nr:flagellar basal-body MS-ring/collar protein FliF [Stieleria varia]TWU02172.1 Flagellar M-ring protein [Stieleria varia]